jgi:hypothetical protein
MKNALVVMCKDACSDTRSAPFSSGMGGRFEPDAGTAVV